MGAESHTDHSKRARPLSSRQRACLRVIAEGALYIKNGSVMRTVESLERRGLVELGGHHHTWQLTDSGRLALDEELDPITAEVLARRTSDCASLAQGSKAEHDPQACERLVWAMGLQLGESRTALTYLRRWRDEPDHDEQFVMDAIAVLESVAPDEERR